MKLDFSFLEVDETVGDIVWVFRVRPTVLFVQFSS